MFTLQHWPILTFVFHGETRGIRNYFLRSTSHIQMLRVKEELSIYTIFWFGFFKCNFSRKTTSFDAWCVFYTISNCSWAFFSNLCHLSCMFPHHLMRAIAVSLLWDSVSQELDWLSLEWWSYLDDRKERLPCVIFVALFLFFCCQWCHDSQLSFILHFTFDCSLLFLFILFCLFSFAPVFPAGGHLVCGEVRRPVTSQNILYFSTPFLLSHLLLYFWQQWSFAVWKPPSLLPWWGQH